jgi:pre-mRNA-splicing factor 38A
MANVTDPLIRALQGTDPQNLMEYITRQKIYDSRYWKEECFGLAAVDVLEKAAKLQTMGGLPSKFLCLVLKLLQLQPEPEDIIESFLQQDDFKYVRALGALYLRLTGRPNDIYNELEPLYRDYRKLRCRMHQNWTLLHMDEFIHQLLTETTCVGITLPRLPARTTLQEAGYLEEGPRPTALREVLEDVGGPAEFLKQKALQHNSPAALELYEKRLVGINNEDSCLKKDAKAKTASTEEIFDNKTTTYGSSNERNKIEQDNERGERQKHSTSGKRKKETEEGEMSADDNKPREKPSKKKKKKDRKFGSLFKDGSKKNDDKARHDTAASSTTAANTQAPEENSDEYWNEQRAKLGLKALK